MSIKNRLLAKTGDLTLPQAAASSAPAPQALPVDPPAAAPQAGSRFPPALPATAARTGPGQMMQFRTQMLAVEGEIGRLREQLQQHEGALPARRLDAAQVLPSRWANRHEDAFQSPQFQKLKQDIASAGGNVQPILVRPLAGQAERFEIVFGHRRHRACAELGLPVLAVIQTGPMSDAELFAAMDRENRARADLSPYEQGLMYRRALDDGLYPSNRKLAESLGVSHTWVANVLAVADLPPPVVACFRSTLELQHRHAKLLQAALQADRKAVLKRAERLRQHSDRPGAAAVLDALLGQGGRSADASAEPGAEIGWAGQGALSHGGRVLGRWRRDGAGHLSLQLDDAVAQALSPEQVAQALAALLPAR